MDELDQNNMEQQASFERETMGSSRNTMYDRDDDVIVIKKSWLVTGVVSLLTFFIGGTLGYFFATATFDFGSTRAGSGGGGGDTIAVVPTQGVVPTAVPAFVQGVSEDDDPVLGPDDAPITIVEFSDYQCPYCKRFRDQTFDALFDKYGDKIKVVFRDFPLESIHPDARTAAYAAECAEDQDKYWEYHDAMFAGQVATGLGIDALVGYAEDLDMDTDEFKECVEDAKHKDEVDKDLADGNLYGVTGTPTFFINGYRLVGAQPLVAFQQLIDQELNK
jgi:protein-disulfide isomerase